jgi:hypothetical protein
VPSQKIPQPSTRDEREGAADAHAGSPVLGPRFPGLDPRVVVFTHPTDWPTWAQRTFAEGIATGLTVGWWTGIPIRGRDRR